MKSFSLSAKLFFSSGLILVIFCVASVGILYRAQTQQAKAEMDVLLKNQTLALSALVNSTATGSLDFEMSPVFISQYSINNPNSFFRFFDFRHGNLLKESARSFQIGCDPNLVSHDVLVEGKLFRTSSILFSPDLDGGVKLSKNILLPELCLLVGIDQSPYQSLVVQTLLSTIPVLVFIVILLIGVLVILVRSLTKDLSALTIALATADFGATHEFPILPSANTPEVKAVVQKLVALHTQAAEVYREMWMFLGRASHQLKTPVAAMQATLDVLLRRERSKEELVSGLADIKLATAQLIHLTKNLIASSRISYEESSLQSEPINLKDFIASQVKMFGAQAKQFGVSVKVISDSEISVRANTFLLSEILGNLIENAILYSPHDKGASVSISWKLENQNVVIIVSDEGPGFSEQVKKSLFQPFIRGDESLIAGSGLGLSIAKKSAQLLSGNVEIQETGLYGSKVVITLPQIVD